MNKGVKIPTHVFFAANRHAPANTKFSEKDADKGQIHKNKVVVDNIILLGKCREPTGQQTMYCCGFKQTVEQKPQQIKREYTQHYQIDDKPWSLVAISEIFSIDSQHDALALLD